MQQLRAETMKNTKYETIIKNKTLDEFEEESDEEE